MSNEPSYLITEKNGLRRVVRKTAQMRAYLNDYNMQNHDNQVKWVEMTEDEAVNEIKNNGQYLQVRDHRVEAISKVLSEKDAEIEALKAQLAATTNIKQLEPAFEVIAKINSAKTIEQVNELIAGDTRKTVLDAAEKAKLKLTNI